ncbi:N-acetylglucosamine-6-phosphate deacetylase [Vibrio salinus]|uniref:N-acetylglucosamine-6-phosphate deacetylase n=1 Tax=Vibrio salinus TaxID=2899784 RepID=UPI001E43146A|nr:N-acetylglucosamine-6-phosphate deacetylase [Vibrio salinus]MCE0495999.1 N-acetylglucosamine-6-phosphate deacetylase [Vibrio salinus]
MLALTNGIVLTGFQRLTNVAVLIKENKIHSIIPESELPSSIEAYDLEGTMLSAGFIDLQVNGCGGVMFNSAPTYSTLKHMQETNLKSGTTSFLPTFISDSDANIKTAVKAVETFTEKHHNQILGMHLEGPFTNVIRRGIHPKEQIRPLTQTMVEWLLRHRKAIKQITLAPELSTAEFIQQLSQSGIIVSIGHSAATYEEATNSFKQGVTSATHLFNAMSSIANGREPGVVGAVFDRKVYSGIIADGHHVHWSNIRLAKTILGDKLCLVTDATAGAMPPSDMTEFNFCGATIYLKDGICCDKNGTLGGSSLTMNNAIRLMAENGGVSVDEAFRMATLYPAHSINMADKLGSIQPDKIANLTQITDNYQIVNTMINGQWTDTVI